MPAARVIARLLATIVVLFFTAACDDDERKAREKKYEVTIYVSDHIQGEIINVRPVRKFTKPQIEIHAPEGVTIVPKETKPRKTTVVDFAPLSSSFLLISLMTLASCYVLSAGRRYAFGASSSPVYQRG